MSAETAPRQILTRNEPEGGTFAAGHPGYAVLARLWSEKCERERRETPRKDKDDE